MIDITAAILAGGLGTRLRSVVADRPKALAEIAGQPFVSYLLDQLAKIRIRTVVLCTGYLGDRVQATFGDSYDGIRLLYSRESAPLGTAGALRLALPLFKSDSVLVMNGDSFCQVDLNRLWRRHRARRAKVTLVLVRVTDAKAYGRVGVDHDGAVVSFEEKIAEKGSAWINAGVYLLDRSLVERIPPNRAVSLEREMLPGWLGRGLYGHLCKGPFFDIGTPETYATAKKLFSRRLK